jgi:hypothetical protein
VIIVVRERISKQREKFVLWYIQLGVKIIPAVGCTGRGDENEKDDRRTEYLLDKSADKTICFHRNTL